MAVVVCRARITGLTCWKKESRKSGMEIRISGKGRDREGKRETEKREREHRGNGEITTTTPEEGRRVRKMWED